MNKLPIEGSLKTIDSMEKIRREVLPGVLHIASSQLPGQGSGPWMDNAERVLNAKHDRRSDQGPQGGPDPDLLSCDYLYDPPGNTTRNVDGAAVVPEAVAIAKPPGRKNTKKERRSSAKWPSSLEEIPASAELLTSACAKKARHK
jgi:hypothetical protein